MGLINQAIPSLFNGVSQQPSQLRLPSQCELSDNFYPTIATGLQKRPPTVLKAKLSSSTDTNAYVAVLNRDSTERYALVLRNGSVEVYDLFTGAAKTVTAPSGLGYLSSSDPKGDFSTVTVADYTFVVNRSKTISMGATTAPSNPNIGYVTFSYNGSAVSRTMTVKVNGTSATYAGAGNVDTAITSISASLTTSLGVGWSVTRPFGNVLRIEKLDSTAWTLTVTDDYGSSTMKAIKGSVPLFSDLPPQLDDGYVCYIAARPESQGRGYYVRFDASSNSYVECPRPGVLTTLDASTMPHKLVRNGDGTFTFAPIDWEPRKVGDDSSNPKPSFVGQKINDVFFYRNRLGFLSDENHILSVAGDYWNFFAKTATAVTDSDPIDEAVSNTKVSILRWAIPFNKVLLLFSDQTQFQLSGGDLLTPKTVKSDPVTEFSSSTKCRPVGAGTELFFVTPRPGHTGLREYFVQQDSLANDAADITAHVPSYIPADAFKLTVSTSEDALVVLTEAERNAMYVYKYYWGKEEKVQSAWFRFKLDAGDIIMGCEFIGSVAHLVIGRSDGIYLEEMTLQPGMTDTGLPFAVLLDRKKALTGSYNAGTNTTTWTLPWPAPGPVQAVLGASFGSRAGAALDLTSTGTYTVTATGDFSAGAAYVGVPYEARYRFSEQHLKDQNNVAISSAKVKLRRMAISYVNSGYFRVEVTPPARDTSRYVFTGKVLGVAGLLLGNPSLASGTFLVPVLSGSQGVVIDLVNDSPLPSVFQNAEWEGEVVVQAKR